MLSANSTRDINQAARSVEKYLKEQGITLPHAKALDLVARTLGSENHMVAQAQLPSVGMTGDVMLNSYRDLLKTLQMLPASQLDMSITVTEGCDENGNAEFFPGFALVRGDSSQIAAASDGVIEDDQPVLLFNGPREESDDDSSVQRATNDKSYAPYAPVAVVEDLCKVLCNQDVVDALGAMAISDAAYDAVAEAAPYLTSKTLRLLNRDMLQRAYDAMPVTSSPREYLAEHGNWGLNEREAHLAQLIAELLFPEAARIDDADDFRTFYDTEHTAPENRGWYWTLAAETGYAYEGSQGVRWDGPYDTEADANADAKSTVSFSANPVANVAVSEEDILRVEAQYEMSTGSRSPSWLRERIAKDGLQAALKYANKKCDLLLSIGGWVMRSDSEQGFWCNGFGWTTSKFAATGYTGMQVNDSLLMKNMPADADWVLFTNATDYDVL